MRIRLIAIFIGTLLVIGLFLFVRNNAQAPAPLSLSVIEIADTNVKREQGLSGRTDISDEYGMLFVFPKAERYGFWMKDMHFAIDIIWVSEEGSIVGITENVSPETYPAVFYPPSPVPYVLEVRGGLSEKRGWATSTVLNLPIPA